MSTFSLYDQQTGLFIGRQLAIGLDPISHELPYAAFVAANTPAGHALMEGEHDHLSRKVDISDPANPKVVDYQPPQPSSDHEWDPDTRRWRLGAGARAAAAAIVATQARIAALEATQAGVIRTAVLTGDLGPLRALDDEIAGLRRQLAE